jgi:hypothetical protein
LSPPDRGVPAPERVAGNEAVKDGEEKKLVFQLIDDSLILKSPSGPAILLVNTTEEPDAVALTRVFKLELLFIEDARLDANDEGVAVWPHPKPVSTPLIEMFSPPPS